MTPEQMLQLLLLIADLRAQVQQVSAENGMLREHLSRAQEALTAANAAATNETAVATAEPEPGPQTRP